MSVSISLPSAFTQTPSTHISHISYSQIPKKRYSFEFRVTPLLYTLLSIAFLIAAVKFYTYLEHHDYPTLAYPLSAYNVDIFTKATSLSQNSLPSLKGRSVYGPLEQQPTDSFKPFNTTSLIYVATLFFLTSVLCI